MEANKQINERRAHKRLSVKKRILVLVGQKTTGALYHVVDISKVGLAFRYLGEQELANNVSELSILLNDNIWLEKVPIKTTSDIHFNIDNISMRRRGLQFDSLTSAQKSQLEEFMQRVDT